MSWMNKTEEIVKKALSLGFDKVIAKTIVGKYGQTRFSNNQIDITKVWKDYVTDLFLSYKKRVIATEIRGFNSIDEQLKKLLKTATLSKENSTFGGFTKGSFKYAQTFADKKLFDLTNPSEYVFEAIEAAKKEVGSQVNCGGMLFHKYEDIFLESSEGPKGKDNRSSIELSIRVFSQREASGQSVECSSSIDGFKPYNAGVEAGEIAKLAMNPKVGDAGEYDVILAPLFSGSMLGVWASMVSAFDILIKRSVFVDKINQKVASEIVTIKDNPASYSVAHRIFDNEGTPTRENVFIDQGKLKTFLHNTSTAKLFKTGTTGNAGLIVPRAWNIEMEAGDMSKDEMLKETKRGLYLTNTWYTRFQNYSSGDFSTIPRDGIFLIKNGEIKESLKDIRLSDNALKMLKNIALISKERKHVHWWEEAEPPSLAPYMLIKDVTTTKSR